MEQILKKFNCLSTKYIGKRKLARSRSEFNVKKLDGADTIIWMRYERSTIIYIYVYNFHSRMTLMSFRWIPGNSFLFVHCNNIYRYFTNYKLHITLTRRYCLVINRTGRKLKFRSRKCSLKLWYLLFTDKRYVCRVVSVSFDFRLFNDIKHFYAISSFSLGT